MRLLVSWVRDFVGVTATPDQIADTLALRGFEVAAIEPAPDDVRPPWSPQAVGPDAVIDFEVTANRPDCLSVVGFAREIATAYDLPHALPLASRSSAGQTDSRLRVTLEDAEGCPRYAAALAEVTASVSPAWMTARLAAAGVRPISPLVDVTNYVLMEMGHPMHAFDHARLDGAELRIRRAAPDEAITTLDAIHRKLTPEMLVIADATRPQAIAGVMGGATSEVSADTRLVAFESACFQPASVRRTSKRLGLKTEASARFERGADINAPVAALERALALMELVGAGTRAGAIVDCYPSPRGPRRLILRRQRIQLLLGVKVPDADVRRILSSLGLTVTPTSAGWEVEAPTFRVDLLREVDLIEEVGRHYGFDKLEPTFPPMVAPAAAPDSRVVRDRQLRQAANAAGLTEAVTFGFVEQAAASTFVEGDAKASLVPIANPLSATFDVLRPSLLPGLVDTVAHNRRHGRRDVAVFEIGACFTATDGERRRIGIAWTGAAEPEHWSRSGRQVDFFDVKGLVETIGSVLDVPLRLAPASIPYLVDGQTARVFAGETAIGPIGVVAPRIVESRGAPRQDKVIVAELDLDTLDAARQPRDGTVRPLPRFPAVVRDLSVVVSDRLSAETIRGTIQAAAVGAPAPLVSIAFFDRYQGKGVADESVSLSVRLTFQSADRTLTDGEVQQSFDRVLAALIHTHGAVQR